MSVSRRDLFGWLPGRAKKEPAPAEAPFSLDALYARRGPPAPLPVFPVRTAVAVPTTSVGVPRPAADGGSSVPRPFAGVVRVRPDACLAHRSICSSCSERCPVPSAIVLDALGRPRVDESLCNGCGICLSVCPAPVLAFEIVARTRDGEVPRG